MEEIVFPCDNCGVNLVAEGDGAGQTVDCPSCGHPVVVPSPIEAKDPESTRRKTIIRIPAAHPAEPAEGEDSEDKEEADEPVTHRRKDTHYIEIVVGWICVAIGVLLAVVLPRAWPAYIPFFIGSFMMGVILLLHGKVAHGLVLLLCTCVPPPLLMRHNLWKELRVPQRASRSSGPSKVVFDSKGQAKLVVDDDPHSAYRPSKRKERLADKGKVTFAQLMGEEPPEAKPTKRASKKSAPSTKPTEASDEAVEMVDPEPELTGAQARDDPYAALLAGTAEVPALIPEDELAQPWNAVEEDFVWQEEQVEALARLPGDPSPVVDVPFVIYSEANDAKTYSHGGTMGNAGSLSVDESWDVEPRFGKNCMRIAYASGMDWVTAAWQHPRENWGDIVGGYDLSKASKLTFWAKGDSGGEEVEFLVGMDQSLNAISRDTLRASSGKIRLKKKWKKYSIPLKKHDRSSIITGFLVRIEGQEEPITFYLDDVKFE